MGRLVGHFDGVDGTRASGWAADPDAPAQVLAVEFFAIAPDRELTKLGRSRANRPRPDLHDIAMTDIHHGFEWRIPFQRGEFLLSARVGGQELQGGPVAVSPRPVHEGSLEAIERGVLRGWAWAWDPAISVEIEIFVDQTRHAVVPARGERPDLALAGIGNGRHGFIWTVPDAFADGAAHAFACRIAGTSVWLSGGPREAIIPSGARSSATAESAVRRYARRPLPASENAGGRLAAYAGQPPGLREVAMAAAGNVQVTTAGELRRQFAAVAGRPRGNATPAAGRRVRLLIPVWGETYIATFCRLGLPSLLSPNNLPHLAGAYPLEVVFLTRGRDRAAFATYPACQRLARLAAVSFRDIDDILQRYFDPAPNGYATALTHAFLRGMHCADDTARETDFVFWNGDFLAADGVFRTLAGLIAAGVRCTLAPSLRVDAAIAPDLLGRVTDGATLDIGPREWVALAAQFRHLTVMAQTVNNFEPRMTDTVNQLYWQLDDSLMVARVFLMFMLHIRPELDPGEIFGHCDYVFVPELVPSGHYHFETSSDRLLIIELQQQERQAGEIILGDRAITPREVAGGVARWTTREHRLASRQLVVFNAEPIRIDLEPVRQLTDRFMDAVYQRLPDPIWHNGHQHWTDSLSALGIPYHDPGPNHPRSHLAAALRWTGYDIDVLRESWPDPAGPPEAIFGLQPPLDPTLNLAAWLASAHDKYLGAWLDLAPGLAGGRSEIDLVSGHFHGFGWGLLRHGALGWARRLGPDGQAVLLARVARAGAVQVWLQILDQPRIRPAALAIRVNGTAPERMLVGAVDGKLLIRFDVGREAVAIDHGRLQILFHAPRAMPAAGEPDPEGLAVVAVMILPVAGVGAGAGVGAREVPRPDALRSVAD